jgi:hypothetical protein
VAVAAGEVCYLSSGAESPALTPGLWYLADADFAVSSTTCQSIGMAVSDIAINTAGTIRIAGLATTASAVVVGGTYYVSATAGGITTSAPALSRVVGVADTTSTLILAATSAVAATLPNPIAQDVLFVDATYDIGKSGASRPRDLFQSRNATIGGTLGVTGATTLSSTLASGALTVTGNETVSGTLGVTGATTLAGGLNTPLVVAQGGSGVATHTPYGVIVGGTTSTAATQTVTPGTSGYLLTSGGASAVPTWAAAVTASAGIEQAFRGLQVQTSPNSDVAATTVSVLGLTQWTADDGTLVDDTLANNTAVISSSGAGGLDTGSEAASVWYEIYRIRKSSDGTLNTLLHRAKNYLLDQSFTTSPDATRALRLATSTATDKLAQGITFTTAGKREFVDVQLIRVGAVSGNIWWTLEADSAGSPSGTPLATSDKIDGSLISTTAQAIRIVTRAPDTGTATLYHLVLQGDYTKSDSVYIGWRGVAAGGYAGGSAKQYNGTSWSAATGVGDFYFKAYVTENDAAVTMPSGYDQQCKLGYVYNDSGSNFDPFVQVENRVFCRAEQHVVSSVATVDLAILTDMSSFLPPVPVTAMFGIAADSDGQVVQVAGVSGGFAANGTVAGTTFNASQGRSNGTGVNAFQGMIGPEPTEFSGLYVVGGAANSHVWLHGWEW